MQPTRGQSGSWLLPPLLLPLLLLAVAQPELQIGAFACERVHFGPTQDQNVACQCDANYCDAQLHFEWPPDDGQAVELLSSQAGARFALRNVTLDSLTSGQKANWKHLDELEAEDGAERVVQLDVNKRRQRVVGYGGAFTDSSSMLIATLDKQTRAHLMQSYFGPGGLDYNLARVPIGGTDMSWRAYSYDDLKMDDSNQAGQQADFEFKHFKLQPEDLDYKLPLIRQANEIRRRAAQTSCERGDGGGDEALRLLASSWSAPNWMKSNANLVQGKLKETSDGKYYDAYARYLIRFMDEYERELNANVSSFSSSNNSARCPPSEQFKIWALTPQNEPCTPGRLGYAVVNYNSVNFEPHEMAQFVRFNLIPNLLRRNRTARELALFIWDDTLLGFDKYREQLFATLLDGEDDEPAMKRKQLTSGYSMYDRQTINEYVRGLALHWYSQGLDKLPYKSLYDLRRWLPGRHSMISTEASFIGRPRPGEWWRGEKYARDIIENFRSGSIGWIDWNLALNLQGGPTWSKNFLDAAILVDDNPNSQTRGKFFKNPMFYAIGHLSRFIKTRSHIVDSQVLINDQLRRYKNATEDALALAALRKQASLTPDEASRLAVLAKDAGWRLVDEIEEQTSDLLVVASELDSSPTEPATRSAWRQIALVLLNRSHRKLPVKVNLANCKSRFGARPLTLELEAKSITSYAFNC